MSEPDDDERPRRAVTAVEHVVAADEAGLTLAAVVRAATAAPWKLAKQLCQRGCVRIDGVVARDAAMRVAAGRRIAIDPRAPTPVAPPSELGRERIVWLDAEVVVVDKPAGLQSVPFAEDDHDSVVQRLTVLLRRIESRRGPPPRVVQRLDKDTTGLMVFARTRIAERELADQLRSHTMHRRYVGICHGAVRGATFDTMLVPDRGDGIRGSWRPRPGQRNAPPTAKRAITRVEPLEVVAIRPELLVSPSSTRRSASLVQCTLETGRTHQIRIHLSEAGHPLVGEHVYAKGRDVPRLVPPFVDGVAVGLRPLLHAAELGFVHPQHGRAMRFERPLPPDAAAWWAHLQGTPGAAFATRPPRDRSR